MRQFSNTFLAMALIIICIGGMSFAASTPYPSAPPYISPTPGEFPLSASYIFYNDNPVTRQDLQRIKDCGFNMFRAGMSENKLRQTLDSLQGSDLKMSFYVWEAFNPNRTVEMVEKYKDNPAIAMYFIRDEPNATQFQDVRKTDSLFRAADSTKINFVNILAKMNSDALKAPDYETYVSEFVRIVNPPMISFDIYPVRESNKKIFVADEFYPTLETIAKVAKESNRPFWAYILSNKHWFYPKPKREYLRFQLFSSLAYGAQGFSYYTYALPDFDRGVGEYSDAPLDENRNPTDVWYMVRDVNNEVKNYTDVFLGAEILDVSHTGVVLPESTRRLVSPPSPFRWISSENEGILVSHLRNHGKEYIVFVNHNVNRKQKVNFSLSRPVTRLMPDGKEKRERGNSVTLSPGGYAIFRL